MKKIAIALLVLLPMTVSAGTISEGVRSVERSNKDEFGYRWNSIVAGLLAVKLHPEILDSTVILEQLLPGLSCASVKLAENEFSWRESRTILKKELKEAASTFNVVSVYAMSAIGLGDYDFASGGFPFGGSILGFNNVFDQGVPVGPVMAPPFSGAEQGTISRNIAIDNLRSQSARTLSPNCDLYVKGSGGREVNIRIVGTPFFLDQVLPIEESDAKKLVAQYPDRSFVLLQQFKISGSELSRDGRTVFLKSEDWKYSLCERTTGPPLCKKIVVSLEMRPFEGRLPPFGLELPSWAGGSNKSKSPVFLDKSKSTGQSSRTYTIKGSEIVKGVGSFFGKMMENNSPTKSKAQNGSESESESSVNESGEQGTENEPQK